jgi:hypothetical protein
MMKNIYKMYMFLNKEFHGGRCVDSIFAIKYNLRFFNQEAIQFFGF